MRAKSGSDFVILPTDIGEQQATWPVRPVSALEFAARTIRSPTGLASLFPEGGDAVLRARIGSANWFVGRSPAWTRHVAGSSRLWADIDIIPLGLRTHHRYYAMGGLPGAPPGLHARARKTAMTAGFQRRPTQQGDIDDALAIALAIARTPGTEELDLRTFARALCFHANAAVVCGIRADQSEIRRVLGWFDRWSAIMSSPLTVLAGSGVPFSPAKQFHRVLGWWYEYLRRILEERDDVVDGLALALRAQVRDGDIEVEEAVGYLATILFAGTEPPSQTLLWGYAHVAGTDPGDVGSLSADDAEALLWESFRVQPAINYLVRRVASESTPYASASNDVFVVAPPLAHEYSNAERGLPQVFTPSLAGRTTLDGDAYPGMGTGVHRCIGAKFGVRLAREALAFLASEAVVRRPGDLTATGRVMARPRRLPTVALLR
jgi:cytochrome P450